MPFAALSRCSLTHVSGQKYGSNAQVGMFSRVFSRHVCVCLSHDRKVCQTRRERYQFMTDMFHAEPLRCCGRYAFYLTCLSALGVCACGYHMIVTVFNL